MTDYSRVLLPVLASRLAAARRPDVERLYDLLGFEEEEDPAAAVVLPECPAFYASSIFRPVRHALSSARRDGHIIAVQGAALGVGVSAVLRDYAIVTQHIAAPGEVPVLVMDLLPRLGSKRTFLDALANALGVRMKITDLRMRAAATIAEDVLLALRILKVRLVILDHAHHLDDVAREIVAYLIRHAGPGSRSRLPALYDAPPIGFVLASHHPPQRVFAELLGVTLDRTPLYIPPYGVEDVADVLGQLDLGVHPVDLARLEHRELVELVFEMTRGHVARMAPLFRAMLALRRPGEPADAQLVRYTASYTEGITRLTSGPAEDPAWGWEPDEVHTVSLPAAQRIQPVAVASVEPGPTLSVERAKKLRGQRALAETHHREITRRPRKRGRDLVS